MFFNYKHFTYFREKANLPSSPSTWTSLPEHQGGKPVSSSGNYIQYVGEPTQLLNGISVSNTTYKRTQGYIPLTSTNIGIYVAAKLSRIYRNHALIIGINTYRTNSLSYGLNILNDSFAIWYNGKYHFLVSKDSGSLTMDDCFDREVLFGISYERTQYRAEAFIADWNTGEIIATYKDNGDRPNFLTNTHSYLFGIFTGDGLSAAGDIFKVAVTTDSSKCITSDTQIKPLVNKLQGME